MFFEEAFKKVIETAEMTLRDAVQAQVPGLRLEIGVEELRMVERGVGSVTIRVRKKPGSGITTMNHDEELASIIGASERLEGLLEDALQKSEDGVSCPGVKHDAGRSVIRFIY